MVIRKCCGTQRGSAPHKPCCPHHHVGRRRLPDYIVGIDVAMRRELLEDIAGDMGDGAYLALAEELGLEVDDLGEDTV